MGQGHWEDGSQFSHTGHLAEHPDLAHWPANPGCQSHSSHALFWKQSTFHSRNSIQTVILPSYQEVQLAGLQCTDLCEL